MIFIFLIFLINILLCYSKFKQAKYLFSLSAILHLSLYLVSSQYAPDYGNISRQFYTIANSSIQIFTTDDYVYTNIIRILTNLKFEYISLPIFSLLLSLYSIYSLAKTFKKSAAIIISSLLFPFLTYLSFCAMRQSMAISFMIIAISLLFRNNFVSFKRIKISIFAYFGLYTHFSSSVYILGFALFYFFGDYLLNLKSNISKIYFKLNKGTIILFIGALIIFLILITFNYKVIGNYFTRFIFYTEVSEGEKYDASSTLLFVIFSNTLSIFTLFKFFKFNIWSLLTKSEKSFVLMNFITLSQVVFLFIAEVVAIRISFFSILVSSVSLAILEKYRKVNISQLRLYNIFINIYFLGLLSLASTLTTYRSLLPF